MLLSLARACDSHTDVCWALCRHDGYDTGYYAEKACVCGLKLVYSEFTQTKLTIPPLPPNRKPGEVVKSRWKDD